MHITERVLREREYAPVVAGHEPHEHVGLVRGEDDLPEGHVVVLPAGGGRISFGY
jgi:hypothetical protein